MSDTFKCDASSSLAQNLGLLYLNKKHTDIILVMGGQQFPAHRLILAVQSEFFEEILLDNPDREFDLPLETTHEVFELLLKFLYTAKISLTGWGESKSFTARELLKLSRRFGVKNLEEVLIKYFMAITKTTNVFEILKLAHSYDLEDLEEHCIRKLDESGTQVFKSKGISHLKTSVLKVILMSSNVKSIRKFYALQTWLKHNGSKVTENKKQDLVELIDVSRLSNWQIIEVLGPSKLFENSKLFDVLVSRGKTDVPEEAESLFCETAKALLGKNISDDNSVILEVPGLQLAWCCSFMSARGSNSVNCELRVSSSTDLEKWWFTFDLKPKRDVYHYYNEQYPFRYVKIEGTCVIRFLKFGLEKEMSHDNCLKK